MNRLAILARVKALAGEWGERQRWATNSEAWRVTTNACEDLRRLQTDIEKSLDEEADAMFEEHQKAEEAGKEGSNAV